MSKIGALIDTLCKTDSEGAADEGNKRRMVGVLAHNLCNKPGKNSGRRK